jgi:tripartite-type tricarboxylate transporter receptor subunit TctC
MPGMIRTRFLASMIAAMACVTACVAGAADYPTRPIRIVAPYPPGSGTDILARIVAQKMTEDWGQQVIVDNRAGAGGSIGTAIGAKGTPDGYTLTMAVSSAMGINPTLYSKLAYAPLKDFAPIANLGLTPQVLVASPSAPFKTVKEFVAAAKENPGRINYASVGVGSTQHLAMEMFRSTAGITLNHVPFKGAPEAYVQMVSGQIPVMMDSIATALPQIKGGKMRGLGIATLKRSPFMSDVPTIAESGYPGFEAIGWIGIAAPAGTPAAILDKLNAEMARIVGSADVKERFNSMAVTPVGDTRAHFASFIRSEMEKWGKAVRESGAKAD